METGMISNIQRFCLDDGPGIRTTVFLKGCFLRCSWCHNPETKEQKKELFFDAEKCIRCGACAAVCENHAHKIGQLHDHDRQLCSVCGVCTRNCPVNALEVTGTEMTVKQVMLQVLRDRVFYENSMGGMTLSGGEPLLQPEFSQHLLQQAKNEGLHTCVETCGYGSTDALHRIAEVTDLFLFDWKLTDPALHKKYTGVDNRKIKEHLLLLDEWGKSVVLRCPVIPGINDTQSHFEGIADLANTLHAILSVEIMPYHDLGADKSRRLAAYADTFPVPADDEKHKWERVLQKLTEKQIKIG